MDPKYSLPERIAQYKSALLILPYHDLSKSTSEKQFGYGSKFGAQNGLPWYMETKTFKPAVQFLVVKHFDPYPFLHSWFPFAGCHCP